MSNYDAAPPNTHAGGDDDALRTHGTLPMNLPAEGDEHVDMEAYRKSVPLWKRIHQNSLTQMILMSIQAFCGPAMADAIAGKFEGLLTLAALSTRQGGSGDDKMKKKKAVWALTRLLVF